MYSDEEMRVLDRIKDLAEIKVCIFFYLRAIKFHHCIEMFCTYYHLKVVENKKSTK